MVVTHRAYDQAQDFSKVGDFLIRHFLPGNADGNWLQPAWEYEHCHPSQDRSLLDRIRIWEHNDQIVAVVNYEGGLGAAFFQFHPAYTHLRCEMLDYAERFLSGTDENGRCYLYAYINDFDLEFTAEAVRRGYHKDDRFRRPLYRLPVPQVFPPIELPHGYCLKSLADENDLSKINRILWRGFNHPGESPEEELEGRRRMQSGPNFRHDLTIVVAAPDGSFVSFCGMWHETTNHIAYVEPVATDPDYRRMGLGRSAVLEGIRRCGMEGATEAFVGSDLEFYQSLGFQEVFTSSGWVKVFEH